MGVLLFLITNMAALQTSYSQIFDSGIGINDK